MFDKKRGFSPFTIGFLMTFSFIGLLGTAIVERLFFESSEGKNFSFIHYFQMFFGIVWLIALVAMVPVQVLYFNRKNRDNSSLQKATIKDILSLPFGVSNPNATLPKWISIPVLAFMWFLMVV